MSPVPVRSAFPLRPSELVERDGIHYRHDASSTAYRQLWEQEAREDHVRSAIATGPTATVDFDTLTRKMSALWERIPHGAHVGTVLELGCGYGRVPLHLAAERRLTWSTYVGVDISDEMLRRLLEYFERFEVVPEAETHLVCTPADSLPLEDSSVDLVLSCAVFLHMGKEYVARAVREAARVLKPGGAFVFDSSFPNARNPVSAVTRLKPKPLRPPHFLKYWTRGEIESLIVDSGLADRAGAFTLAPSAYGLLPRSLPLARRVNGAFRPRLAHLGYSAYSEAPLR